MDIKDLALILLIGRTVAVFFMSLVIKKQLFLLRFPVPPEVRKFRTILTALSVSLLLVNVLPIVLDLLTIFSTNNLTRTARPGIVGITYTLDNCLGAVIASILVWMLYRLASNTKDVTDFETKQLTDKLMRRK